jgi:hypothetical protein
LAFAFHKYHVVFICIVTFLTDKVKVALSFSGSAVSARGEMWGIQPLAS